MTFLVEIAPRIALFLVVAVAALPAISQSRMLLLGAAAFYTAGTFASVCIGGCGQPPGTIALLLGMFAGGFAGLVLAAVATHLRGDYFALASLCYAELLRLVLLINPPFPGPQGIPGIQRGTVFGLSLDSPSAMAITTIALLVLVCVITTAAIRSPWGSALQASYDNEKAARTSGISVDRLRLGALVYAGLWSGLAGALGVRYLSLADATTFSLSNSIMVLIVILLAARPSVARCLAFGFAVATLSEALRFVSTGAVREIVFGGLLFVAAFVLRDDLRSADSTGRMP